MARWTPAPMFRRATHPVRAAAMCRRMRYLPTSRWIRGVPMSPWIRPWIPQHRTFTSSTCQMRAASVATPRTLMRSMAVASTCRRPTPPIPAARWTSLSAARQPRAQPDVAIAAITALPRRVTLRAAAAVRHAKLAVRVSSAMARPASAPAPLALQVAARMRSPAFLLRNNRMDNAVPEKPARLVPRQCNHATRPTDCARAHQPHAPRAVATVMRAYRMRTRTTVLAVRAVPRAVRAVPASIATARAHASRPRGAKPKCYLRA